MALEQKIEQKLVQMVRKAGGQCYKFTSPGTAGMPDRCVILPGNKIAFVEVKAPGHRPRPLQQRRHRQLQALGVMVRTLDNPHHIQDLIHEIQTT